MGPARVFIDKIAKNWNQNAWRSQ